MKNNHGLFAAGLLIFILCSLCGITSSYGLSSNPDKVYGFLLDLPIEELGKISIQSSALFPLEQKKSPGTTYVIGTNQLEKYNIRSIAEYLNMQIPGVSSTIHGTQGVTIGVRGILIDNTSKTLFLRDNININNRKFVGINGADLSSPLLGDIDRLEVSLGPGAMRHGSGAINGAINVVSATGRSKDGIRINTSYGSGDSRQLEASYGHIFSDRANIFAYGGYNKSDGVRPHYTLPTDQWSALNGVTGTPSQTFLDTVRVGKTDDDYKFSFRAQLGQDNDLFSLDLKGLLSHTSNVDPVLGEYLSPNADWAKEIQLAAEGRGGRYSPFYEQHSENLLISPEIKIRFNSYNSIDIIPYYHKVKTTSVFSDFLKDEVAAQNITITPLGAPAACPALNCLEEYSYGDELHLGTTIIQNYSGAEMQNIAWGAEIKYFEFKNNLWHWTTVSAFGEDQISYGNFTLLAGLRYDKTYFGNQIDPVVPFNEAPYQAPDDVEKFTSRLALSYQLNENQTAKISYQEGFRFADSWLHEWTAHLNTVNGTNNQIYPEESESYEANYSITNLFEQALNLKASLFYNIYHDTQGFIPSLNTFGNAQETITSTGGELSLLYAPGSGFEGQISYSYARPIDSFEDSIKVANNDNTWTRYPDQMLKMLLGYKITDNLFIGGNGLLESPRYEKAQTTDPTVKDLFDQWSFVMNANLWYQLNQHIRLSFTAKELIHINYNQTPAYFNGTRPLDSPRAAEPQYYLSATFSY